jgi:hypothetical protein
MLSFKYYAKQELRQNSTCFNKAMKKKHCYLDDYKQKNKARPSPDLILNVVSALMTVIMLHTC